MKQQLEDFDEKEIDRTEAIIRSMTPGERRNPKVLNGSRRLRIARGSGMTVTDVNALVNRFEQAAKMMKTVARGGTPNIPGMGPIPGSRPGASAKRGKQPRRRARARATPPSAPPRTPASRRRRPPAPTGSGFGLGGGGAGAGAPERGRPRRAAEAARQGLSARCGSLGWIAADASVRRVVSRDEVLAQRRAGAELADEVLHDLAEVAVRGIRHHQLPRVARTLGQDRLEPGELARALELDGDVADALERLAQVLARPAPACPRGRR